MGVGGAFIMPSTLSILTNVFHDPVERRRAIGLWAGFAGLGALGPLVGGFLLSHFWWGSVFLVNVPLVLIGLVAGYFLIPDSRDPSSPKLDPLGAVLSITGLGTVLWAVIEAPSTGWGSRPILTAFAVGFVVIGLFVAWERTYASPMLNIEFFRDPRFSVASAAITLTFFALFGTLFLLTQYMQIVLGFSTLKAGAVLLPQAIVMMFTAPRSSKLVGRFGNKRVVAGGLFVVTLGLLLLATLDENSAAIMLVVMGMVLGLGMGNVMAPATDSIMGSLPRAKAGVGSAVNDTTRQTGGAVGVAVLGSLMASRYTSHVSALLGDTVPPVVKDNVGAAKAYALTALRSQPELRDRVLHAAYSSFVSGYHYAAITGAAIVFVTMLGVLRWLPGRTADYEEPTPPTSSGA
jgi:EmrB/QacA subfamily drug resistance transporter